MALVNRWLKISMNPSTGDGGTCYGDSGGPYFLDDMVVSITVTGDAYCRATDVNYRTDSVSARSFLGQFVDLPLSLVAVNHPPGRLGSAEAAGFLAGICMRSKIVLKTSATIMMMPPMTNTARGLMAW